MINYIFSFDCSLMNTSLKTLRSTFADASEVFETLSSQKSFWDWASVTELCNNFLIV